MSINYALGRWTALVRYCDDGSLKIGKNSAERHYVQFGLGRKNYLFATSDYGG